MLNCGVFLEMTLLSKSFRGHAQRRVDCIKSLFRVKLDTIVMLGKPHMRTADTESKVTVPQIPVANIDTKAATISWVGWDGRKASSRLSGFAVATTEAQVLAVINAMGTISNAGIWKQEYKSISQAAIPAVTTYDEAVSDIDRGVNITYQNTVTLATKIFRLPAPHHDYLTPEGRFLKDRGLDVDIDALLTSIEVALGASWLFVNAPLSTRSDGTDLAVQLPILEEPAP